MSILRLVNDLLAGMVDLRTKLDVAATINFLYNMYRIGRIDRETLRGELEEIVSTILRLRYPNMSDEEMQARMESIVGSFMNYIILSSINRRMGLFQIERR